MGGSRWLFRCRVDRGPQSQLRVSGASRYPEAQIPDPSACISTPCGLQHPLAALPPNTQLSSDLLKPGLERKRLWASAPLTLQGNSFSAWARGVYLAASSSNLPYPRRTQSLFVTTKPVCCCSQTGPQDSHPLRLKATVPRFAASCTSPSLCQGKDSERHSVFSIFLNWDL